MSNPKSTVPSKYAPSRDNRFTFLLDDEEKELLVKFAEQERETVSAIIRRHLKPIIRPETAQSPQQ